MLTKPACMRATWRAGVARRKKLRPCPCRPAISVNAVASICASRTSAAAHGAPPKRPRPRSSFRNPTRSDGRSADGDAGMPGAARSATEADTANGHEEMTASGLACESTPLARETASPSDGCSVPVRRFSPRQVPRCPGFASTNQSLACVACALAIPGQRNLFQVQRLSERRSAFGQDHEGAEQSHQPQTAAQHQPRDVGTGKMSI